MKSNLAIYTLDSLVREWGLFVKNAGFLWIQCFMIQMAMHILGLLAHALFDVILLFEQPDCQHVDDPKVLSYRSILYHSQ